MNEAFQVFCYALLLLACIIMWTRVFMLAILEPINFLAAFFAAVIASIITYIAVVFFPDMYVIKRNGNIDLVLVGIFIFMTVVLVATAYGFLVTAKTKRQFTMGVGQVLVIGPALVWSLVWLITLRIAGPMHFEVFGEQKIVNTSFSVSFSIFMVLFIGEYVGNLRNIEAKMAEVMTFWGGKRTGQALTEGFNPLPGIIPLFFQSLAFSLFRFSIFWGAVRGFITTPITFAGTMIAYSYDGKAVVFNVSGIGKIINPTIADDLMEDGAENPREQLKRLFAEYFQQGANAFIRTCQWQSLVDGVGFGGRMVKSMTGSMKHLGLELKNISIEWLGFQDQEQQRIFQQLAGNDIRHMNQSMKAEEIERILRSGVSREDAERIWEAFTKDGRGSFRFSS